jgi:hypothetical protein
VGEGISVGIDGSKLGVGVAVGTANVRLAIRVKIADVYLAGFLGRVRVGVRLAVKTAVRLEVRAGETEVAGRACKTAHASNGKASRIKSLRRTWNLVYGITCFVSNAINYRETPNAEIVSHLSLFQNGNY